MVEAVVNAVDVSKPAVPACPLTIADPTLGEANHPATIGIDAIAEVKVLYLYLMLARHNGSNDVLVLADGGEGRIVLDPAQHVRYTGGVHKISPYGPGSGVLLAPPGPSLYDNHSVSIFPVFVNNLLTFSTSWYIISVC